MSLFDANHRLLWTDSGRWGEGTHFPSRCEFYLPFEQLGIIAGQNMRVYAEASQANSFQHCDRIPDEGDIQISPIPALGKTMFYILWAVILTAGIVLIKKSCYKDVPSV